MLYAVASRLVCVLIDGTDGWHIHIFIFQISADDFRMRVRNKDSHL